MNRKKLICIILSIALVVSSLAAISFAVFANDSDANGTYSYNSITKTLEIFSDDAMTDKTEDSYIEAPWNNYRTSVEEIIVHDGVTKIGDFAFCRMNNLETVEIADSVNSIGEAAFAESGLKEITISSNVNAIGDNAFGTETQDFVCNCPISSYAQNWCLANYVPFDTPFPESLSAPANVTNAGEKLYWSFVPLTDCKITYSASGKYDTFGAIYDASSYSYPKMSSTAIATNDDKNDDELNFSITTNLSAGKRYYLSTNLKSSVKTGNYDVSLTQVCTSHIYKITSIEGNILTGKKSLVNAKCVGCRNTTSTDFGSAVVNNTDYCDVNNDGIVNAKDYAMIIHDKY